MTVHLSIDGITTSCGRPLGELAEDSYTTDPDLAGCLECESLLGRPQDAAAVAVAYGQGYGRWQGEGLPRIGTVAAGGPLSRLWLPALPGGPGAGAKGVGSGFRGITTGPRP